MTAVSVRQRVKERKVMSEKRSGKAFGNCSFRTLPENDVRLTEAEKLGYKQSVLNDFMQDCWDAWFEKKRLDRIAELEQSLKKAKR
jgi:hypothetical protein